MNRYFRFAALTCLITGWATALLARGAPEPLPTPDEIHQLYAQQAYPLVLQKLQRVLVLKGDAASAYDRHDLLRLRGETQLRMKAAAPAAQAFADAAEAATDLNDAAMDKSTELLIKRSPSLSYTRKIKVLGKSATPTSIVESDNRKSALLALFDDEMAAIEPKMKAIRDARQIAPIMAVIPAIKQVRILELAATGADERTKKLTADLGTRARDLMAEAMKSMSRNVDDIEKRANEYITLQQGSVDARTHTSHVETFWRKRGLAAKDPATLKDAATTCAKIIQATREIADALGAKDSVFDTVRTDAEKLGRKSEQVLNDDYTQLHVTRPT